MTSHGGPTAQASTGLSLSTQAFTSRGIAFLDVDYGGSTGYGRDYRRSLEGEWGVVDVDDCVAGAAWLAEQRLVDGGRLAIRGGSASGFTTLAALAFRDVFDAGITYFGIGDLEAFVRETHKFESRYLDRLIGPLPEAQELYDARSPNFHAEGIGAPVLILQGAEDRVVPPAEAERIRRGPCGERHTACPPHLPRRGPRVPPGVLDPAGVRGRALVPRPGVRLHGGRRHPAGAAGHHLRVSSAGRVLPCRRIRMERAW